MPGRRSADVSAATEAEATAAITWWEFETATPTPLWSIEWRSCMHSGGKAGRSSTDVAALGPPSALPTSSGSSLSQGVVIIWVCVLFGRGPTPVER